MKLNLGYPLRHWLTSLAIGPFIAFIYETISYKVPNDALGTYFLFVTFGLVFSLPTFILYVLTFNKLLQTKMSGWTIKVVLDIVAVLGVIVTFSLIKGSMTLKASIFYSVAILISSTFFRVRQKEIEGQTSDV